MSDDHAGDDVRRLDLDRLKKEAKALCRASRAGERSALERLHRHHPKSGSRDLGKLADAQLVIARELGLPTWPALKARVGAIEQARDAIRSRAAPPDAAIATLHVRCGSDIRDGLRRAGFAGDFLAFADPFCQGPVTDGSNLIDTRARFVADAYNIPYDEARARGSAEHQALTAAPHRYPRIVLWFEHDSYDQLILAHILARMSAAPPQILELICIDRFPTVNRFRGLGQLSEVALRSLWSERKPVSARQMRLGRAVWQALCAPTPLALHALAAGGTPELPTMAGALRRHLWELPWTQDGLSLTERLALQALAGGAMTGAALFGAVQRADPLPFLGDEMFWAVLRDLSAPEAGPSPITLGPARRRWPELRVARSAIGDALLENRLDWRGLTQRERWVGGVRIPAGAKGWRWCPERGHPVEAR